MMNVEPNENKKYMHSVIPIKISTTFTEIFTVHDHIHKKCALDYGFHY